MSQTHVWNHDYGNVYLCHVTPDQVIVRIEHDPCGEPRWQTVYDGRDIDKAYRAVRWARRKVG